MGRKLMIQLMWANTQTTARWKGKVSTLRNFRNGVDLVHDAAMRNISFTQEITLRNFVMRNYCLHKTFNFLGILYTYSLKKHISWSHQCSCIENMGTRNGNIWKDHSILCTQFPLSTWWRNDILPMAYKGVLMNLLIWDMSVRWWSVSRARGYSECVAIFMIEIRSIKIWLGYLICIFKMCNKKL